MHRQKSTNEKKGCSEKKSLRIAQLIPVIGTNGLWFLQLGRIPSIIRHFPPFSVYSNYDLNPSMAICNCANKHFEWTDPAYTWLDNKMTCGHSIRFFSIIFFFFEKYTKSKKKIIYFRRIFLTVLRYMYFDGNTFFFSKAALQRGIYLKNAVHLYDIDDDESESVINS